MLSMSSIITGWTAVEMTGLPVGSLPCRLAAQIPMERENPAVPPHTGLALQAPRFDETPRSSAPAEPNTSTGTNSNGPALVERKIHQLLAAQTSSTGCFAFKGAGTGLHPGTGKG